MTQSTKVGLLCRFKSLSYPLIRGSRDLIILLFLVTETGTFSNGEFPYKCKYLFLKGNFYLSFRVFLVSEAS